MASKLTHDVAKTIFGTAVAGYGFSIGRDAWRMTKKHFWMWVMAFVVAAGFYFPYRAPKHLVQYSGRRWFGWFFLTLIGNLVLWIVGAALFHYLYIIGAGLFLAIADQHLAPNLAHFLDSIGWAILGAITLVGLAHGLLLRPKRVHAAQIQHVNDRFLEQHGISETHGDTVTHIDGDGNRLRLLEINDHEVVFMAVGRRGKRAYISLDSDGVMQNYTPVGAA